MTEKAQVTLAPRLTRAQASAYLMERHGVSCRATTLEKYAYVGGGPKFERFGRRVLYTPANLDCWVQTKLRAPAECG